MNTMKKFFKTFLGLPVGLALVFALLGTPALTAVTTEPVMVAQANPTPSGFKYSSLPEWNGRSPYAKVHDNKPYFSSKQLRNRKSYEKYSDLDSLGRCTTAIACIGTDIMPTRQRGAIGMVRPTGWHTVKYAGIDGNYLYNRCHLIGYQLSGENANVKNLITGTRYMNVDGMLPFENEIAGYMESHEKNHVLYRVTPVFSGKDLLARGVLMEAQSIEDGGRGVKFCVFCYNVQPGVTIKYSDGSSSGPEFKGSGSSGNTSGHGNTTGTRASQPDSGKHEYVLNTSTKKFHRTSCSSIRLMADRNKKTVKEKRSTLISEGYEPCKRCKP